MMLNGGFRQAGMQPAGAAAAGCLLEEAAEKRGVGKTMHAWSVAE